MALTDLLPSNAFGNAVKGGAQWSVQSDLNPVKWVVKGRDFLDTKANTYIVKPKTAHGIGGFIFDCELDTSVTLQADITEHYTENNTFIMDHVAHKPARLTLRGLIGEVARLPPQGVTGALSNFQTKLTTLPAMLGKYTPGALAKIQRAVSKATETVNKIDNYISRAQNLTALFVGSTPGKTLQERAYIDLYAKWRISAILTVETPYKYFESMVIEQISFMQSEETKAFSDVSVTLKEIRFARDTSTGGLNVSEAKQNCDGRLAYAIQGQANQGRTNGTTTDISELSRIA